ncbi:GNAT family N-acetyltransferase [Thalassotalea sp. SU-HH00458]|uniref:GNAT family N-acetyltransferase n=1 Tax=Thalassotalea sp. SU-HH00458 TaxID=3127657 RepID=UPI003107563C
MNPKLMFKQNVSNENDVAVHFELCEKSFTNDISLRTSLTGYIEKIVSKSFRFEAWDNRKLIGLIAVYINFDSFCGYITNVSVIKECNGLGVAKSLLKECCNQLIQQGITELSLEVKTTNTKAIGLYTKFGFVKENEANTYLRMILNLKSNKYDK